MKSKRAEKVARRNRRLQKKRRRIEWRLRRRNWSEQSEPMMRARNIQYEVGERVRVLGAGGIGAMLQVAQRSGLVKEIDNRVHVLKRHQPYHESDHVLNIALNVLAGGTCLEDIEMLRTDEAYLDALGAQRVPDPTTAGDFCRRFKRRDVEHLMEAVNEARLNVWRQQPDSFFEEAFLDFDGSLAPTNGECKEGMGLSYKGVWGYHPLIGTLRNTDEPLILENRPGNRPSAEGAARRVDQGIAYLRRAGFRRITLGGDTDFSQTEHLDRWDRPDVRFIFGYDARKNLVRVASELPKKAWQPLVRRQRHEVRTKPRQRPDNVKERIVKERGYKNIRLESEHVAEFPYQPTKCGKPYRMVVLRKNLSVKKGEAALFDDVRYFFYITNNWESPASEIVFISNGRCSQEKIIEQLKNGVHALRVPVGNLESNWAYMVMATLAWNLKAWYALLLREGDSWKGKHRSEKKTLLGMNFKTFTNYFVRIPAQIIRGGRRIVYRLLAWNPFQEVFFRGVDALRQPLRC